MEYQAISGLCDCSKTCVPNIWVIFSPKNGVCLKAYTIELFQVVINPNFNFSNEKFKNYFIMECRTSFFNNDGETGRKQTARITHRYRLLVRPRSILVVGSKDYCNSTISLLTLTVCSPFS